MPHIFFERLERRRSTQTLVVGYQGFSGSSMGQSYSGSGVIYAIFPIWPGPYGPYGHGPDGLYGGMYGGYGPQPTLSIYQSLYQLYQTQWQTSVPSMNFLNTFQNNDMNNLLTSPTAPISNLWQNPTLQTPSFGYPNSYEYGLGGFGLGQIWTLPENVTCYLVGPFMPDSFSGTPMSGGVSKLEKVRENLIAFFQHKGILSGNQGKRLVFSLFDKA